jgi:hypothetical protein
MIPEIHSGSTTSVEDPLALSYGRVVHLGRSQGWVGALSDSGEISTVQVPASSLTTFTAPLGMK